MRRTRILAIGFFGCTAVAAALLLIALWRSFTPSESARLLERIHADRPRAPAADNAYIYLWGFSAPAGSDPLAMASKRLDWMEAKLGQQHYKTPDPLGKRVSLESRRSDLMRRLVKECAGSAATPCAAAFEGWPLDATLTEWETLTARRYQELLTRHRWYESLEYDFASELPPFAEALDGQR